MDTILVNENGLYMVIEVSEKKDVRLLHLSSVPYEDKYLGEQHKKKFRLVEIHLSGENQNDHHGSKHTGSSLGNRLTYVENRDYSTTIGRKLEIYMEGSDLFVVVHFQFYDGIPVIRAWTEIKNNSNKAVGIEYISSFALTGIGKEGIASWDKKCRLHIPHNAWVSELQWRDYSLPELGLSKVYSFSTKPVSVSSTGTWSTSQYLPMGMLSNNEIGTILFWQIEHNGSWHWEIGDVSEGFSPDAKEGYLYLNLSGPTENENHWWKKLQPGESFVAVPVAVGSVNGSTDEVFSALTWYRRAIRRKNKDNEELPVIFNDYMNCLFGDPTTEKLIPLIDEASSIGCEYFCIDAGWYSDGEWWEGVGEWLPSERRFPKGIKEPLDYIRSKGMIPGLWLEIEVMGIQCPLVEKVSENWFFNRHGKPVIDHGRYQLDFRNPQVVDHANSVVHRLVNEYGVGYIKMDYNINAGTGTDIDSDSFGDGLLEHNRAYLKWLDGIFSKYPELIVENCGSGGMRMDYAMLSRCSIQSTSDQCDYRVYAAIAAASITAVTPEQAAVWSYPLKVGDKEEVVFNMVNAMLLRIHQSGNLAEITNERKDLIREGILYYKSIRKDIKISNPFWPLGLPTFYDQWISLGLRQGKKSYLAVWRLQAETDVCTLSIGTLKGKEVSVKCAYPAQNDSMISWSKESGLLSIKMPVQYTARLFELEES